MLRISLRISGPEVTAEQRSHANSPAPTSRDGSPGAGARHHVGEVRILVDPEFRNQRLGTAMIRELATIANESGLEILTFEIVAEKEDAAIAAAQFVGFVPVGVLSDHAKDPDRHPRDLVMLEMFLGKWFESWY